MAAPKFHVILRSCDAVHSLHNAPRPFGLDKKMLIKVCFASLVKALGTNDHTITVLGDRLSEETARFFEQFPVRLIRGEWGNDESLRQAMLLAFELPERDWVYLCEDDYLHSPQAFTWVADLIEHKDEYIRSKRFFPRIGMKRALSTLPIVIHPPDYPDRYQPKYLRFSLIFLAKYCHWRQVTDTTFTFLAEGKTFRKYKKLLLDSCRGANDRYLSRKLYAGRRFVNKAICLSPIPGVATHMHEEVMTPLVDWKEIADALVRDIKQ